MQNEDYELWEAMMADEPSVAPAAVAPAPGEPVFETPALDSYTDETHTFIPFEQKIETAAIEIVPTVQPILSFDTIIDEETEEEDLFPTNLFKEPQTNSIQVAEIPDALSADIVTESGEVLKTGAIDMPILTNTGSIAIITGPVERIDEDAIIADMGDETTSGIPPIRSGSVMNSSAKVGVMPIKNRRSEGQTVLLATTSILLVTLGALVIAASMFKLI